MINLLVGEDSEVVMDKREKAEFLNSKLAPVFLHKESGPICHTVCGGVGGER